MEEIRNAGLKQYTTVRMGGTAERMLIPETPEELISVLESEHPACLIGGGSNLLIADHSFPLVVNLRKFDPSLEDLGGGRFRAGASLRLQSLIQGINEKGYGGIEYLYSVPGLVGGALVMNAGRGESYHQSIADYVVSVRIWQRGEVRDLSRAECGFAYRDSLFRREGDCVILSAEFLFPEKSREETEKARKDRLALCRQVQDTSAPNFGTVFCRADPRIMALVKRLRLSGKGVAFSGKTANWILNTGDGSLKEADALMKIVEFMHRIMRKECRREVILWR